MKRFSCLILVTMGWLASCTTPVTHDLHTDINEFTKLRTDLMLENVLPSSTPQVTEEISINAARVFKTLAKFDYYLEVRYRATRQTGLLDIAPGTSLIIIADGQEIRFSGSGSQIARDRGNLVREDALYALGADDLRSIAYAKAVHIQVTGRNRTVERDFAPENSARFLKFVRAFVEGGQ